MVYSIALRLKPLFLVEHKTECDEAYLCQNQAGLVTLDQLVLAEDVMRPIYVRSVGFSGG